MRKTAKLKEHTNVQINTVYKIFKDRQYFVQTSSQYQSSYCWYPKYGRLQIVHDQDKFHILFDLKNQYKATLMFIWEKFKNIYCR